MDKQALKKQIDMAEARYGETKDPAAREEIQRLSSRLAEFQHLTTLENALGRSEDMRNSEVVRALYELAKAMPESWPINQYLTAINYVNEEGRWQLANAALNAIRFYVTR